MRRKMTMRLRILLGFTLALLLIGTLTWKLSKRSVVEERIAFDNPSPAPTTEPSAAPSPATSPTPAEIMVQPTPTLEPTPVQQSSASGLIIPVVGVRPDQLQDTFTAARSEGRSHDAIDIPAPKGTPVLAVADGPIVKLFLSKPGGITVYQLATDNRTIYYYAHLERYADGLSEGHFARQGETIAYVGDTGNATPGNYHLHFSVSLVKDPKRWWEGTNVNPYPLLRAAGR